MEGLSMCIHARLTPESVYLWTLPMFHCNGWNFPWAVVAAGGQYIKVENGIGEQSDWNNVYRIMGNDSRLMYL